MQQNTYDDLTPEEWQLISEQAEKPICFNFMILPMVPEHADTLLDRDGKPVTANYTNVDWKGLAQRLQARLDGHVPKSIKVYVANDGPDLFDINEFRADRPDEPEPDNSFVYRTAKALENVSMANYRGGLLKLPDDSGLHLNQESAGQQRTPLTALVVGVKFNKMLQALDYLPTTMEMLVGLSFAVPMAQVSMVHDMDEPGTLPSEIHGWLEEQFGAVYSEKCGVMFMSVTQSN